MQKKNELGLTIPELVVGLVLLAVFILLSLQLYVSMLGSASFAIVKSTGLGVATEQMEYLRSLPYDYLAIQGGAIQSSGPKIPAEKEVTISGRAYTVRSTIQYADDAYDGCFTYTSETAYLCRNGPVKAGAPTETNPKDYKLVGVIVIDKNSGREAARLSTQIAARVAETAGNTGAIIVEIINSKGEPVAGAEVTISNTTIPSPGFSPQKLTTDTDGVANFLDVPPDTGKDFVISASKSGYSTNSTKSFPSNGLVPSYPNASVISQKPTNVSIIIDPIATDSLSLAFVSQETGAPIPNASFNIKGGTKTYITATDQTYNYDQTLTTDASGKIMIHNLTPGPYFVCFNNSQCSPGKYATVVQVASGNGSTQPIIVPAGSEQSPMQEAKIYVSQDASYPRITAMTPATVLAAASNISSVPMKVTGANLYGAVLTLRQGATTIITTASGADSENSITRVANLSGKSGAWEIVLTRGSSTIVQTGLRAELGGINVE